MRRWEILLVATMILILLLGRQMSDIGRELAKEPASQRALRRALLAIFAFVIVGVVYALARQ